MRRHGTFMGLMLLVLLALPASGQGDDGCRDVLVYSARTESLETYDLAIAVRTYEQYCENDSVRSGTEFNVGLDAVIKAVPIKFRLGSGSTEERVKAFCKTFDSEYRRNETTYRQISQVVNETTNAWLACKTLAAQGVLFRPRISSTQVIIEVARTNAAPASVEGITYDRTLLSCTVPNSDNSKKRTAADDTTTKALTDAYWPITCLRLPKSTPNETIYPKVDISVGTTRGAFLLPVAAEASYPYQWSSDLQRQLNKLKSDMEAKLQRPIARCTFVDDSDVTLGPLEFDNAVLDFPVCTVDTHTAVTHSNNQWKFTAPVSGWYRVTASAMAVHGFVSLSLLSSTNKVISLSNHLSRKPGYAESVMGTNLIRLEQGQSIMVRATGRFDDRARFEGRGTSNWIDVVHIRD